MTIKINDLKTIIKLANLLDKKNLFKEADILDQIIIKISRESDQKYIDLISFFTFILNNYLDSLFVIQPGTENTLVSFDLKQNYKNSLYDIYKQYTPNRLSESVFKNIFSKLTILIEKTTDPGKQGGIQVKKRLLKIYIDNTFLNLINQEFKKINNKNINLNDTKDLLSITYALINVKKDTIEHELTHLINYARTIENLQSSNKTMLCHNCKEKTSPLDSFCPSCGTMTRAGLSTDQWGRQKAQGLYRTLNEQGAITQEYVDSTEEIQARLIPLINSKKNDPKIIKALVEENPRQFISEITKDLEGWNRIQEGDAIYSQQQRNRIIGRIYEVYNSLLNKFKKENMQFEIVE